MTNRIGIFNYYDNDGETDMAAIDTLLDLKKCVSYLIVVVNGFLQDCSLFRNAADEVIVRDNVGYDAGAYKAVICSDKHKELIANAYELVLCNSSFYGPFIPFKTIFEQMTNRKADFWGISMHDSNINRHIQSFFLVYRRRILADSVLYSMFDKYIDETTIDYLNVCYRFENLLFHFLERAGYSSDAYVKDITCNNYKNPYGSLALDGLPIIKKKIFAPEFYDSKKARYALAYVAKNYQYDFSNMLNSIKRKYGKEYKLDELTKCSLQNQLTKNYQKQLDIIPVESLHEFIEQQDKVYIYGTGSFARAVIYLEEPSVWDKKLQGFIISDGHKKINQTPFIRYPVYYLFEVKDKDTAIIVALNKKNTEEVKCLLSANQYKVFYLYYDT